MPSSSPSKWFWPIVIVLLCALVVIWAFTPVTESPEPIPEQTPDPNWTTAPEGPAVPVQLPDTPVRVVPADKASPSPTPRPEQ